MSYRLFFLIVPSYNSFLLDLKTGGTHFPQNKKTNLLDLEHIDLGLPTLHTIEILSQITSSKNLVILAFIGAELAGKSRF